MLNRKFIVAAVVGVLAFFGILTFALNQNDTPKDQNTDKNTQEEAPSNQEEKEDDKTTDGNDQGNEQLPNPNQPQQQAPQVGREVGNVDEGDKEDEVEEETDKTAPVFAFDHNYDLEQYHRGVVGISVSAQDDESGVDGDSLKYLWSTSPERPSDEDTNWQSFDNGSSILSLPNVSGAYYLHVYATDTNGNARYDRVGPFMLDNDAPKFKGLSYGYHTTGNIKVEVIEDNLKSIAAHKDHSSTAIIIENGDELTEEGTYRLVATDMADNETSIYVAIDKTAPKFKNLKSGAHYNTAIKVVAEDDYLDTIEVFNQDTNEKFTIQSGEELTEEATYQVTAKDKAGNKTVYWVAKDSTYPKITGVEDGKKYNDKVNFTIYDKYLTSVTVNDEKVEIGAPSGLGNIKDKHYYVDLEYDTNGTYVIVAKDKIGNTTTITFVIDKTEPSFIFEHTYDMTKYYKKVGIMVSAQDNETEIDTNSLKYLWSTSSERPSDDDADWQAFINGNVINSPTKISGAYYLHVYAKDAAGNAGYDKIGPFNLDDILPLFKDLYIGYHTTGNIKVEVIDENTKTIYVYNQDNPEKSKYINSGEELTEEATYKITVTDKAGNSDYVWVAIDRTNPEITSVVDGGYYNDDGGYYNDKVTVTVSDKFLYEVKLNDTLYTHERKELEQYGPNKEYFRRIFELSNEGTYKIIGKDKANNTKTVEFTIDKTVPTVISTEHSPSTPTNDKVVVTLTFSEEVNVLTDGWNKVCGTVWSKEFTNNVDSETVEFEDLARNLGSTNVNVSNIDKQPPVIKSVSGNPTNWTNETIILTVTAEDNFGGELQYQFNGGAWTKNSTYEVASNQTVTIKVKDETGNESLPKTVKVNKIDKSAPNLTATRAHGDAIVFHSSYKSSIKVNYSDVGNSGIAVAKYAKGVQDKSYFASNGTSINNNGTISNVKKGEVYTIYVKDKAGNDTLITVNSNIYGSNEIVDLGNVKISVGAKYEVYEWVRVLLIHMYLPVNYRDLTVTTSNGVTLTRYAKDYGYRSLSYFTKTNPVTPNNQFKPLKIRRDEQQYHTIYLEDSTGKKYLIWIEIEDVFN